MRKLKTHTFNGRKYRIEFVERIDGVTDTPDKPESYHMLILDGDDLKALHSALHEGLEGIGCCDKCIHGYGKNSLPKTWDVARLLRRMGYRKTKSTSTNANAAKKDG